jgi:hypothetical protein
MNHKAKVKLARKMPRTAMDDMPPREGKFQTEAWERRKDAIQARVKRQQDAAHARALARKEAISRKA